MSDDPEWRGGMDRGELEQRREHAARRSALEWLTTLRRQLRPLSGSDRTPQPEEQP